ncbi:uncharacterized protein LOC111102138 [Crassostrea virginica]
MLGIDRNEKKRRHFTLLHDNIEFRYHHENHGKIYWACKVPGCSGMLEEDNYKIKVVRDHNHVRTREMEPSKRWQNNPWYHTESATDHYKYDPVEAYNINNTLKTKKPSYPASRPPSYRSGEDNRAPRYYYFDMPPRKAQPRSMPTSHLAGQPPGVAKRSHSDSDVSAESLRTVMNCDDQRQRRFWVVMGFLGIAALIVVAISLSFYFIDKSRINNHTVKQAEETLLQETSTSQSTVTKTSVSQTSAHQSTSVKPGGVSMTTTQTTLTQTVSTKTSAKPTSTQTSTSTTETTITEKSQASSLSTVPVMFSGSMMLNKSWTPALNDSSSLQHQIFTNALVYELNTAFLTSPLKHLFNHSQVTGFSPGSVKVYYKVVFFSVVKEDGEIDSSSVNTTQVQQTIEREVTRQQTTRTNGFLSSVMAGSLTIKLVNAPVVFNGALSLNQSWNATLSDPNSPMFQNLSAQLKEELLASLIKALGNEFFDVKILGFREGSINVIFKIIMTVNTTEDTPQIEVATVIQAIQSEANRQLQEAVTGLLQKLITLSLDNQTLATTSTQQTTTITGPPTTTTTTVPPATTTTVPPTTTTTVTPTTTTTTVPPTTTTTIPPTTTTTIPPTTTTTVPPTTTTTVPPTTTTTVPPTTTTTIPLTTTTTIPPTTTTTVPPTTTTTTIPPTTTTTVPPTTTTTVPPTTTTTIPPTTTTTIPPTTTTTVPPTTTTTVPPTTTTMVPPTTTTTTIPPTTTTTVPPTTTTTVPPTTTTAVPPTTTTTTIPPTTTTTSPPTTTTTVPPTTTTTTIPPTTTTTVPPTTTTTVPPTTTTTVPPTTTTTVPPTTTTTVPPTTTTTTVPPTTTTTTVPPTTTTTSPPTTTTTVPPTTTTTVPPTTTTTVPPTTTTTVPPTPTTTVPPTTTTTTIPPTTTTTIPPTTTTTVPPTTTTTTVPPTTTTTVPPTTTTTTVPPTTTTTTVPPTTTTTSPPTTTTTVPPTTTTTVPPTTTTTVPPTTTTTVPPTTTTTTIPPTTTTTTVPPTTTTTSPPTTTTTVPPTTTTTVPPTTTTTAVPPTTTTTTIPPTTTTTVPPTTTTTTIPPTTTTTTVPPTTTTTSPPTTTTTVPPTTTTTVPPTTTTTVSPTTTTTTVPPTTTTTVPPTTTTTVPPTTTTTVPPTTTTTTVPPTTTTTTVPPTTTTTSPPTTTTTVPPTTTTTVPPTTTTTVPPTTTTTVPPTTTTTTIPPTTTTTTVPPTTTTTVPPTTTTTSPPTTTTTVPPTTTTTVPPTTTTTVPPTTTTTTIPPTTTIPTTTTTTVPLSTTTTTMVPSTTTTVAPKTTTVPSTTTTTETLTTSSFSSACQDIKSLATKGWICVLPYYHIVITNTTLDEFCRNMKIVFTCIVELLESDYNVTCPPGSVETVAGLYGPKLQSTIDMYHNVTKCDFRPEVKTTSMSTTTLTTASTMLSTLASTTTPINHPRQHQSIIHDNTNQSSTTTEPRVTTTPPSTPASSTEPPSPRICRDNNTILTKGWNCVLPHVINVTTATDVEQFCSIVFDVFDCVAGGIERQHNVSCNRKERDYAVDVFSPMFRTAFNLKHNPADCYLVTTKVTMSSTTTSLLSSSLSTTSDPTSKPSTTYSTSTTPSPLLAKCSDSGVVLEKSLMCVLPYYVNISMAKDKEAFCSIVDQIFQCIMSEIEAEFRVSCTEKDKEFALISYGPILQSSLSLSFKPMECEFKSHTTAGPPSSESTPSVSTTVKTTPTTSGQLTTSATTPGSTQPTSTRSSFFEQCRNDGEIMAKGWQCALPLYGNLTTAQNLLQFCRGMLKVIVCITSDIGQRYGVNCSTADEQYALSYYGPTLVASLPLSFDPANCSLDSDGLSVNPQTIVTVTPTQVTQVPITPTPTESPLLQKCGESNAILSKGWVCALPLYMNISLTTDMTAFCRIADSVFTCILDSISSAYGVRCTPGYKDLVVTAYSTNLQSISTTSLDPRLCYITTTTSTTVSTTESPLLAKCQDSATITSAAYFCFLPLYMNMTTAKDKPEFCSVIDVGFSCILNKIETEYSIRCRHGDKERMISQYGPVLFSTLQLQFDPRADCNISSEANTRVVRSVGKEQSPSCHNSVTLFAKGLFCMAPVYQNLVNESSSLDRFCRLIGNFSVCVLAEMGKEYNITCDESERAIFIHNHSLSMQTTLSLAFQPADCLVISTTSVGPTSTPAPNRCQDSELVYDHLMLCAGPFFLSWKSERNETSFCRLTGNIFGCIVNKIGKSENLNCSDSDAANAAQIYGSQIFEKLVLPIDPSTCFPPEISTTQSVKPTTMLSTASSLLSTELSTTSSLPSSEPISSTPTSMSTTRKPSPCQDVIKMNTYILPCIGPVFASISSANNLTTLCGMMNDVFGCIVNRIEIEINETCLADDRVILVKAIGLQINSTLALPFSLDFCISRMEDSLTESSTTPVSYTPRSTYSVTTPITTAASSTPRTPTPSHCQDPTQINSFILPCTGPMIFYLTSAKNETTYCGYIFRVFGCIVEKTEMDTNRSCSQDEVEDIVQKVGVQLNETLPLPYDLFRCYKDNDSKQTTFTPEVKSTPIPDSMCRRKTEVFSHGVHCIGPVYFVLVMQGNDMKMNYSMSCGILEYVFNCISERIEQQHNITCSLMERKEAKSMYAVDIYRSISQSFDPNACPDSIGCFEEVGKEENSVCSKAYFAFEKYQGSAYNLKLSQNEICSLYRGSLMCLKEHIIQCSYMDIHKIVSHYLKDSNSSIDITACSVNATSEPVCEDKEYSKLMIQGECGFYPMLIPYDCKRHGMDYINCAAGTLSLFNCRVNSYVRAVAVLLEAGSQFYDRINGGQGVAVITCLNETISSMNIQPDPDENNDFPTGPLPEVMLMAISMLLSDIKWKSELLDSTSPYFRSVAQDVIQNLTVTFAHHPRILQLEIISFRNAPSGSMTTVDLELSFNTTLLGSLDADLQQMASNDFYNLNVMSTFLNSRSSRNTSCPPVTSVPSICVDTCRGDSDCQTDEKCCSNGCSRTCQNSTDIRTHFTNMLNYPDFKALPGYAAQLLVSVSLSDFNWTRELLDPQSPTYQALRSYVISNFEKQMQQSPESIQFEVQAFREDGIVIADLIITYDVRLFDPSSLINIVYQLQRHGYIYRLRIQGSIAHDKLIKPGVCPYLSLAILRSCSSNCTGDSTCEGHSKCCFNGCARTCVDPGWHSGSVMSPFSTTPVTTYTYSSTTRETIQQPTVPSLVQQMALILKLDAYTWTIDLLDETSDYYQRLRKAVISNFAEQFRIMPGYIGMEVESFRSGGLFVDLVLSYNSALADTASLLNTFFLLIHHGSIHNLKVHNYLRFDRVVRSGRCPPIPELGTCAVGCVGDSMCLPTQKCCSNGCGKTCVDILETPNSTPIMTSSRTTAKLITTAATTKPFATQITQHVPTTTLRAPTNQPDHAGSLSVTLELIDYAWNASLLTPQSSYYRHLYSTIRTNIFQSFRLKPGITSVDIISFRSKHNRADLLLQYNTNSIALIDIITSLIADRASGAIYDLKIGNYMTFDTQMRPGTCPAVVVTGTCVENCMGDSTCPGGEKCCSTGCGRVCSTPT